MQHRLDFSPTQTTEIIETTFSVAFYRSIQVSLVAFAVQDTILPQQTWRAWSQGLSRTNGPCCTRKKVSRLKIFTTRLEISVPTRATTCSSVWEVITRRVRNPCYLCVEWMGIIGIAGAAKATLSGIQRPENRLLSNRQLQMSFATITTPRSWPRSLISQLMWPRL